MGVRILFGSPPYLPPVLSAEVLRGLRDLDGSRPCQDGLDRALRWIGDREIPIEQALEEAESVLASRDLEWGLRALGISGDGDDEGYGDSFNHDDGSGSGDGCGYGSGFGDGDGFGYGYAYYGHGSGDGSGYGYGYGDGSGFGEEI